MMQVWWSGDSRYDVVERKRHERHMSFERDMLNH